MDLFIEKLEYLKSRRKIAKLEVYTLGNFMISRTDGQVSVNDWGREKAVQLFQYLITARNRRAQHKEQIISRLWVDADEKTGDRDFKVALHGISKALEPNRKSREASQFIVRQGLTYHLDMRSIWVDAEMMEHFIALGNETVSHHAELAVASYREAIDLYKGPFLPNRLYEDWSSEERERLQVLALGAHVTLADLIISDNPMESVRLCQKALQIDPAWEDAYEVQIRAYLAKGNRPLAIRTFRQCASVLMEEFGIEPLPQTKKLIQQIK